MRYHIWRWSVLNNEWFISAHSRGGFIDINEAYRRLEDIVNRLVGRDIPADAHFIVSDDRKVPPPR